MRNATPHTYYERIFKPLHRHLQCSSPFLFPYFSLLAILQDILVIPTLNRGIPTEWLSQKPFNPPLADRKSPKRIRRYPHFSPPNRITPQMSNTFQPALVQPGRAYCMHFPSYSKKNSHPVPIPRKNKKRALGTNFRPQTPLCYKGPAGMDMTGQWRSGLCWWRHACMQCTSPRFSSPLGSAAAVCCCLEGASWLGNWVYRLEPFGNYKYHPRAERTV